MRKPRTVFWITKAIVPILCAGVTIAGGIEIVLEPDEITIREGERIPVSVTVVNRGPSAVTLVKPGDGSASGWRTPVIGWWVVDARLTDKRHPQHISERTGGRCGNINALRIEEVFQLGPGQTIRLDEWLWRPPMNKAGKFRVAFHYRNVPQLQWSGLPLGTHDSEAMRLIRESTEVSIWSNEIAVTVGESEDLSSN
jgi:hypothetical protein